MKNLPEPAKHSLSNLPAHWRRVPLKHVAGINVVSLPEDTDPAYEFCYIDISSVTSSGEVKLSEPITFVAAPSRARRLVRPGDVLVSTVRTYLRAIAAAPESDHPLIASTGFAVVSPGANMNPAFLRLWLESPAFVEDVVARSEGVSYPATTATDVGNIYTPVPPLLEQAALVNNISLELQQHAKMRREVDLQLARIAEHRQALITAAVTGQIDLAEEES